MKPRVTVEEQPDPALREHILRPLLAYNAEKIGLRPLGVFAIFLRDPDNDDIVGGLWARCFYDWVFVENLFVPPALRGQGFGKSLLAQAEAQARMKGCVGVWLDTFSFHAPAFYQKHGYEIFGALENYPGEHMRYFLRKCLA